MYRLQVYIYLSVKGYQEVVNHIICTGYRRKGVLTIPFGRGAILQQWRVSLDRNCTTLLVWLATL